MAKICSTCGDILNQEGYAQDDVLAPRFISIGIQTEPLEEDEDSAKISQSDQGVGDTTIT